MTQREEFEVWAIENGYKLKLEENGDYDNDFTFSAYEAWQAAKAQTVSQWIPVSERLPEQSQLGSTVEYLVYETLNNKVQHDYYIVPGDGTSPFWNYYQDHVTDWMPLPSAPEQQK